MTYKGVVSPHLPFQVSIARREQWLASTVAKFPLDTSREQLLFVPETSYLYVCACLSLEAILSWRQRQFHQDVAGGHLHATRYVHTKPYSISQKRSREIIWSGSRRIIMTEYHPHASPKRPRRHPIQILHDATTPMSPFCGRPPVRAFPCCGPPGWPRALAYAQDRLSRA